MGRSHPAQYTCMTLAAAVIAELLYDAEYLNL